MADLNFNPYAFIAPRTKAEFVALLDEAILMGQQLNTMLDEAFAHVRRGDGGIREPKP